MRQAPTALVIIVGVVAWWWHAGRAVRLRRDYRLGDVVSGYLLSKHGCTALKYDYSTKYPCSIATKYLRQTCMPQNWDALCAIAHREPGARDDRGKTVLHLRLGDVAERSEIKALWAAKWPCTQRDCEYVRPKSYYVSNILPGLVAANVSSVVVVGSSAHCARPAGCHSTNSIWYRNKLVSLLQHRGYRVDLRWNHDADDDFVTMASARLFVPGGGGFSAAAARCATFTLPPERFGLR
jgi:hypothetical protein